MYLTCMTSYKNKINLYIYIYKYKLILLLIYIYICECVPVCVRVCVYVCAGHLYTVFTHLSALLECQSSQQ